MTANKTAKIQFYEGTDEPVVPEIRLTRSKDGTTGQALFLFFAVLIFFLSLIQNLGAPLS